MAEVGRAISSVGVVGAGAMGAGIAQVAAVGGAEVRLYDQAPSVALAAVEAIAGRLRREAEKGRIERYDAEAAIARLAAVETLDALAGVDLVIEAIIERLDAKQALFKALEPIVGPDAILATNTSSLSVGAIAAGLERPGRVAGLHFFNPAPVMKLVEVVSALATDPIVAERVRAAATAWGKEAVLVRDAPGFIVNRVARPFYGEGFRAWRESVAEAVNLDAIFRDCGGFRMGPLELADLIGHDVNLAVAKSVFDAYFGETRFLPSTLQAELVAAGRLGRKSGRGIYDYGTGAPPSAPRPLDPVAERPQRVRIASALGVLAGLEARLAEAGLAVETDPDLEAESLAFDGVVAHLADGTSLAERAAWSGERDLVQLDLVRDAGSAKTIALARRGRTDVVVGGFQAAGFAVVELADRPGLVLMRTLCQLANAAADAARDGLAAPEDIDRAMVFGVNYPVGPLAWAEAIGWSRVVETLRAIAQSEGDTRYAPSSWLSARALDEAACA